MNLTWQDSDQIAWQLSDNNPNVDPLSLSFTRLREMVLALPDFYGKAEDSNEALLEAIQMAWYEEVR